MIWNAMVWNRLMNDLFERPVWTIFCVLDIVTTLLRSYTTSLGEKNDDDEDDDKNDFH